MREFTSRKVRSVVLENLDARDETKAGTDQFSAKPPVSMNLVRLERSINDLGDSLTQLTNALNPILTPEVEDEDAPSEKETIDGPPMSDLANILIEDNARIRSIIFRMDRLARRLEV